jgi:hypothetical protein
MIVPVCHALTGELLSIELAEGVLVEELRMALKVRDMPALCILQKECSAPSFYQPTAEANWSRNRQSGEHWATTPYFPLPPNTVYEVIVLHPPQVLICEWDPTSNLDKGKPLKQYGLPKEGHTIFFYDTSWFNSVCSKPESIFLRNLAVLWFLFCDFSTMWRGGGGG